MISDTHNPEEPFAPELEHYRTDNAPIDDSERPFRVDVDQLPRRLGLFGLRRLNTKEVGRVMESVDVASKLANRPLSNTEKTVLARHFVDRETTGSYRYLGVLGGLAFWQQHRATYKFPFRKVDPDFDPTRFLFLRDRMARVAWQSLRFSVYGTLGILLTSSVMDPVTMALGAKKMQQDPRLQDWNKDVQQHVKEVRSNRQAGGQSSVTGQRSTVSAAARRRRQEDDMSPQSGDQDPYMNTDTRTSMFPDSQSQSSSNELMASGRGQGQDQDRGDFYRDNASSSGEDTSIGSAPQSSWERLRQQAKAGRSTMSEGSGLDPGQGNHDRWQSRPQSDLSTAMSRRDVDSQLAKSEAQADFDARLERERRGQDFDGSSSVRPR